jgi:hypothetical protein
MWTGRCEHCGIGEGTHVVGCPGLAEEEGYWARRRGEDIMRRNNADYGPNPYEPPKPDGGANDGYISPHSLDAAGEKPVRIPKFREVETGDVHRLHLEQDGWEIQYPHHTWINARESYALGRDTLENVLQYVTETNPPPGPPIPVYKQVPEPTLHERARTLFYLAFSLLFLGVGFIPLVAMLFR